MNTVPCLRCRQRVEPKAPSHGWLALNIAFWVVMVALSPVYGGLVGLSLVLVPMLIAMSFSIGTTADLAKTWTCPMCHGGVQKPIPDERGHRVHHHPILAH